MRENPYVSLFAYEREKAGKSTARMQYEVRRMVVALKKVRECERVLNSECRDDDEREERRCNRIKRSGRIRANRRMLRENTTEPASLKLPTQLGKTS
tara:strand:+ start:483 stop:773 length:291 start_codon:yes stop_codon:yes gene_type:complete